MAVVTIIGAGMMGSALAFPAGENGHEVRLVGTPLDREIIEVSIKTGRHPKLESDFPKTVKYYQVEQMEAAIEGSDMIIGGVSSFGVDWFCDNVLPKIPESIPVLTVTKGLYDTPEGKLLTYPDVWQKKLNAIGSSLKLNAIGGPCTSYELVAHDQTEVAFCGHDIETLKYLKSIMATDYYHISLSTDVVGIESAVALKNGYALGIALTIGLNQKNFGIDSPLHFNSQAAVFGQSVKEMKRLLAFQGADTLENLCVGAGDLYVTVYGGRKFRYGTIWFDLHFISYRSTTRGCTSGSHSTTMGNGVGITHAGAGVFRHVYTLRNRRALRFLGALARGHHLEVRIRKTIGARVLLI